MQVGWWNVVRRPRALIGTALAFALAVLAVVLIAGFADGLYAGVTAFVRNTPAELWVTQAGVRSIGASQVPVSLAAQVATVDGVKGVYPIYQVQHIAVVNGRNLPVAIFGYDPGNGVGGPWRLTEGRLPANGSEVVLDTVFASKFGISRGDSFAMLGKEFRVSGLSADTNSFMAFAVFMPASELSRLIRADSWVSALAVSVEPGVDLEAMRNRMPAGYEVSTRNELSEAYVENIARVMGGPLNLLMVVAFLVGLAVIALTTYSGVLERRAEYGVLKALGMPLSGLAAIVGTEVLVGAVVGILLGGIVAVAVAVSARLVLPSYPIVITQASLLRTVLMGVAMGLLGAIVPVWRIGRENPATVFRV